MSRKRRGKRTRPQAEETANSAAPDATQEETRPPRRRSVLREYVEAFAVAIVLALLVRTFVVQAFKIPSGSMIPTLLEGDHILVNKFTYDGFLGLSGLFGGEPKHPRRGDVVVFRYPVNPEQDFIKRVIAVGGETVEVRDKYVYVDGERVADTHAYFLYGRGAERRAGSFDPRADNMPPVRVPEGAIFIMGDNRDSSLDSRFWGFAKESEVYGRAFLIYWSWDSRSCLNRSSDPLERLLGLWKCVRWDRLGKPIH